MDTIAKYSLSAHMVEVLKRSLSTSGHVVTEATRATEAALIRRGLAVAVTGTTSRRNRYSRHAQTVYGAHLGARLNADGIAVAQALTA